MEELNDNQKKYLLSFFETDKYAGWKNIATKLIENGKCIVAGTECIWKGGIGNFIKTSNADDLVDCLVYDFDLKVFMTSWYYIDDLTEYVQDASEAAQKASVLQ